MRFSLWPMLPAVFFATPLSAGFYDGNQMHENCKKMQFYVMSYVAGAFDAAETAQSAMGKIYVAGMDPKTFSSPVTGFDEAYADQASKIGYYCPPNGAVLQQVTDIFCQYLAATPSERQEPANILLAKALSKAWPCTVPKTKNDSSKRLK